MGILLPLMILVTTLGLFISLPIRSTGDSTLVENIFGHLEHQKGRKEK
jgi:hypothetical protein